jgi:NAD(P)-dependent dehydrogenase (short-subunit alcohol dehydrogenase family)
MDIRGAGAVVSGGASGLGEATCRMLAGAGATVTIADIDADRGAALASELGGAFVRCDVTDEEQVDAAVERAAGGDAPLRIAVACAGIGWASRLIGRDGSPHALEPYERVVAVNLVGTFNLWRVAASAMARSEPLESGERGVLVGTASVAASEGQIGQVSYAAAKAGVIGMTLPAARDLSPVGIRVCTVAPGLFDTPIFGQLPDEQRQALAKDVVFPKRLGTADEFARLVQAICEISYLNGETIRLDGALRMAPK